MRLSMTSEVIDRALRLRQASANTREQAMNDVARKWVGAYGWFLTAAGAFFWTAIIPSLDGGVRLFYALVGQPADEDPFATAGARLTASLVGAVMVGWGLTTVAAAGAAAGASLTRGFSLALLAWYVIDSGASIAAGYPLNAVSNTAIIALFFAPLFWLSRRRPPR